MTQTYTDAIGNTELQIGGTQGGGPELYLGDASALSGDSDPGGGTLSTTAASITTEAGGSVQMGPAGTFTYTPPPGLDSGSDSFTYQVDASEGTSATATATIEFGGARVWYVDNTLLSNGDGTSTSPFNSLAALDEVTTSPGDVIFLYGGGASYSGGVTLSSDQSLVGESAGLTVDDSTLLAPTGTNPSLTNNSGAGVTLTGDGDTVAGVNIDDTSGDGISATGVNGFTLTGVSIDDSGADGLYVYGGDGSIVAGASIAGSAAHSVEIDDRSGGTATLSGTINDHGSGVVLAGNSGATINFTGAITADTSTATASARPAAEP